MGKYDFSNVENQIEMTECQLKDEMERYRNQGNKSSTLLTVFGILFLFIPQIFLFFTNNYSICKWYIWMILAVYCLSGLISIILFLAFLWPSKVSQKSIPKVFYEELMQKYIEDDYDDEQANKGVQYSYLNHINQCLIDYKETNRRKGIFHFWVYRCIVIASLCYLFLIPYIVSHENKEPLKVIIMSDDQKEKKIMKPSNAIPVVPVKTREGFSLKPDSSESHLRRAEVNRAVSGTSKKNEKK